jgi:riboflavin biosynthesis pyrimidine reductase
MKKRRRGAGGTCLAVVVISAICLLRNDSSSNRRCCAIVAVEAKPEWKVHQQQQQPRHQRRSHLPDDNDDDSEASTDAAAVDAVLSLVRQSQERFFLASSSSSESLSHRPFVTLAFAMSLDGKIAVQQQPVHNNQARHDEDADTTEPLRSATSYSSSNLPISGSSSRRLTHGLRSLHDGIMIGRGTAVIDAPRLNNRLYHNHNHNKNDIHQPRPIILDPRGRCRTDTAMLRNFVKRPILVMVLEATAATSSSSSTTTMAKISGDDDDDDDESKERGIPLYDVLHVVAEQQRLKPRQNHNEHDDDRKGGRGGLSHVTGDNDGFSRGNNKEKPEKDDGNDNNDDNNDRSLCLDLRTTLQSLRATYGIKSVMVEGGAETLHSFLFAASQQQQLRRRRADDNWLLYDCLCLTINPTMVLGQRHGISPFREAMSLSSHFHLAGNVDHNDVNGEDDDDDDDMVLVDVTRLGNDLQLTYIRRRWCCGYHRHDHQ